MQSKITAPSSTPAEYQGKVVDSLRADLRARDKLIASLYQRIDTLEKLDEISPERPKWTLPSPSVKINHATPVLLLSDCHFDEVVNPDEVEGVNEYNREIAARRLKRVLSGMIELTRKHISGLKYDGLVLMLGGDMLSGNIHEELVETNEDTVLGSVDYWADQLAALVDGCAREYGSVHICGVVGNHGRNTKRPRAKLRVRDNFDWFLYRLLSRAYKNDGRITFDIPESTDVNVKLYDWNFRLTHGDQFKGGSGISGMLSPILLGAYRKSRRQASMKRPHDYLCLGHWHSLFYGKGIIVNGCFTADTIVQTANGISAIENIHVGDRIMSHNGTVQMVTNVFQQQSTNGLVALKVRGLPEPVTATPNHLIWAIKGETKNGQTIGVKWGRLKGGADKPQWIPIDFLSPGDYVHVPRPTPCLEKDTLSLDQGWMVGLYLAEGHTLLDGGKTKHHHRIGLTMHEREFGVLQRWAAIFEETYGHKPRVFRRKRVGHTSDLVVSPGRELCARFREDFGHLAIGKRIPWFLMDCSKALAGAIVRGWFDGDGHTTKDGVTSATTISKVLAYQMFRLALIAGLRPSLAMLTRGGRRVHDSYTVHLNRGQESTEVDGQLFYRVHARYRRNEVATVYDLEVGGEHTYTAGLAGVHNSLKGADEYSYVSNFDFERPQQAFFLVTPEQGLTFPLSVYGESR